MIDLNVAYASVKKFNTISGVLDSPDYFTLDLYNSLGFEELVESVDALEQSNPVEILDGALDELYIILGKLQILEKMGYNVQEGLNRVCNNNLSKFPVISGVSDVWPKDYQKFVNTEYNVIVLKNKEGKTMKPPGFKPVDLSDCVPKDNA